MCAVLKTTVIFYSIDTPDFNFDIAIKNIYDRLVNDPTVDINSLHKILIEKSFDNENIIEEKEVFLHQLIESYGETVD